MSTSVSLSGTHRSVEPRPRKNPFTGEMQMVHDHWIEPEEQAAIDAVLAQHDVKQHPDGSLSVLLYNERYPDGFPMQGVRKDDHIIFFDSVSLSKPACVILVALASKANLAIDGDTFGAVASVEAQNTMGDEYAIVHSGEELYELIQASFGD